jgi:RNA polymerase sigma-70 factor (ECF subfamily)
MGTTSMIGNSTSYATAETAQDDTALVHACKRGDAAAFEQLVKRYDRRLLSIAQNVTHNREDAQDAVQEAFLKVFRRLTQFQEKSQFSTWLIRITVNESLMKLRKQRSNREASLDEDFQGEEDMSPLEVADWAPNPEELYRETELRDILRRTLQELQPGLRVVFVLRDIEGLSTNETAEVLELTPVAVKTRLGRARLQLREKLSEYFGVGVTCSERPAIEDGDGRHHSSSRMADRSQGEGLVLARLL